MGWFSDEFKFGGTPPLTRAMDLREMDPQNASWDQMYQNLHVARVSAENAAALLQEVVANPGAEPRIGELYAVSAAVHILMGEAYCAGLPFSTTEPEIEYGQPLSTDQIMDRAIERLGMADQFTGGSSSIANFSKVLRGRALLNQGNYGAAARGGRGRADGLRVRDRPLHQLGARRELHVRRQLGAPTATPCRRTRAATAWTSPPRTIRGCRRSSWACQGSTRETPMYRYLKLVSRASPVETASGNEARMIEAEAQLNAGDIAGWLVTLNSTRATVELGPLDDPGTADARVDLMLRERAFWLFNTGAPPGRHEAPGAPSTGAWRARCIRGASTTRTT